MKIGVLGAGAIGCYYGGILAKEEVDVTFIAKGQTLERLRDHALIVKSINGDFSLPVKVSNAENLEKDRSFDYILLAIKSTALNAVIPELSVLMGPKTKVVSLLNGIGNEERLAEVFGAEHIVGGSAFISIIREAPGVVNHVGDGKLVIGEWEEENQANGTLHELKEALVHSGAEVQITNHIRQIKWEKLLWNITYNPLTALTRTRVGEALSDADLHGLLKRISEEFLSVAAKSGIQIREQYIAGLLTPDEKIRNHKTSMLQDLENGREMEVDAILGFVIQTADQCGAHVPTIETIYHLLRYTERQNQ
ncbi:2-dehydropantoate 2-reductase [Sporolactobacillus shoreicorticis]|uniref:2-dehydropantoate 2-reductase n=1 Tax=Sporolactobacillus shoreicorticis TaxID=1923877 RepID=A0ABW5S4F2_9BACL|nr:2-dehydropantoate 2-reductase [Sporolactobacillus shoreicorticis]MCO7128129.1 2-dehydropantoate 2-reductase [Sporolactobacillus shoreicorticis]